MKRNEWYCFPSKNNPKIYINKTSSLESALKLYQPYSKKGYIAKKIVNSCCPVSFFSINTDQSIQLQLVAIYQRIVEILGENVSAVNYSLGTPGPHQKITAQVIDKKGDIYCYVKIAAKETLGQLLDTEKKALELIADTFGNKSFQFPKVLAWESFDLQQMIFLSAAPHAKRASLKLNNVDILFITDLHQHCGRPLSIDNYLQNLVDELNRSEVDGSIINELSEGVNIISTFLPGNQFETCFSHGDYAPWNTFSDSEKDIFIFDWEYFSANRPLFYDLFHYVFMTERLVNNASAEDVVKKLMALWLNPLCNPLFREKKITFEQMCVYLSLYLMDQMTRLSKDYSAYIVYLMNCLSLVVEALAKCRSRQKILVAAYACESDVGSEPGVGWNWLTQIAKNHDVTVLTKANNRVSIEKGIVENPHLSINPVYVSVPKWLSFWKKKQRGVRTYYYLWQFFAYLHARKLNRDMEFDLGHHVTFVNDWLWTFFSLLPIPFIWGPIGSNSKLPSAFVTKNDFKVKEFIRLFIQRFVRLFDPLFWLSALRSSTVLGINKNICNSFPLNCLVKDKFLVEPAIGIDNVNSQDVLLQNKKTIKYLFVGRLIPIKNPVLALEAFSELIKENLTKEVELIIVGEGSEEKALKTKVEEYGLQESVQFVSWVSREEVIELMNTVDVFLFPSVEGGGMVVLEAMASGLPVICLDFGGAGQMVDKSSGFLIPIDDYKNAVLGLKKAMIQLINDDLRLKIGAAGKLRAGTYFSWDNKGVFIDSVYKCLGQISIK